MFNIKLKKKQSDQLWDLIHQKNASIYLCGDAKGMASDVHNVLKKLAQENLQLSEQQAESYLQVLGSSNRYSIDVW